MAQYEMVGRAGKHSEGGEKFHGDIIETDKPLDKMFANKFRKLGEPEEPKPVKKVGKTKPVAKSPLPAPFPAAIDEGGRGKVEPAKRGSKVKDQIDEDNDNDDEDVETEATAGLKDDAVSGFGEDITLTFDEVGESKVKVFRDDSSKLFTIVSSEEPEVPLNKEEIKTRQAVKKFLKEYQGTAQE